MLADVQGQLNDWWAPALAFAAGVVSCASPCVLPLMPGYLAFVTGQAAEQRGGNDAGLGDAGPSDAGRGVAVLARDRLGPILLFIAGFTAVFTLVFGFTASAASRWIRSAVGQRVSGALVLAFGAFMLLYAFRVGLPFLYREERPLLSRIRPGRGWAFPLGMAFAAGWTPCIGPVLGGILFLASAQGSTGRAVVLLLFYSLGLGLPFLLIGLGIDKLMKPFRFFSRNYHWFAGVSGVFLMAIGVLLISGLWVRLLSPLLTLVNRFTPPI